MNKLTVYMGGRRSFCLFTGDVLKRILKRINE